MKWGVRIVVAVLALAACSCLAPQSAHMVSVDVSSWSEADSLIYENCDTLSQRNLNIAIRYNDNFKARVLPLKIGVTVPDARYFEEVVNLQITHPNSVPMATTVESLPYRSKVVLSQRGAYIFAFTPLTEVCGVEAIGIEIIN